jgi:hypothetical protein
LAASLSVSSFLPLSMVIGCSAGHLKGSNKPGRFALPCGIAPFGPFTAFVAAQLRADLIDYHDVHLRHVSNGCGKKTDGKGEQHKSTECIDCDIYRIGHWSITLRQEIMDSAYRVPGIGHQDRSSLNDALRIGGPVAARVVE